MGGLTEYDGEVMWWCDDDVPMQEPYCMIGTATTLPKDETYEPQELRPIGFIWPEKNDG